MATDTKQQRQPSNPKKAITRKATAQIDSEISGDNITNLIKPYRIKIVLHCGCGYSTQELDKAVEHCLASRHSLTVSGIVEHIRRIPKSKIQEAKESQEKFDTSFDELRRRLVGISSSSTSPS